MNAFQTRRNFVGAAGVAAAAVTTAALSRSASAQTVPAVPKMDYAIKKLPLRPGPDQGPVGEAAAQPLRQQLHRRGEAAWRDQQPVRRARSGDAGFVVNGLKREELIAWNSMILHELYFAGLGAEHRPGALPERPSNATSAAMRAGAPSSRPWARRSAAARAG